MTRTTALVLAALALLVVAGMVAGCGIRRDRGEEPANVADVRGRPARASDAPADREARRDEGDDEADDEGEEARGPGAAADPEARKEGGGEEADDEGEEARAASGGQDREGGRPEWMEAMAARLAAAGATAADIEAIEAHRTKQRELMEPLREALGGLREAGGEDAADAQAKQAVSQYEAAKKMALTQLAQGEQDLKMKLNLATKPKLHAMLLSMGALDNGMRGMGGMRGRRPGGERGRGGPRGGGDRPGGRGGGAPRGR